MFTPIASSKSTVVGLRLDHDRRAWVEAAAARHGVTIRALFEAMIDQAREEEAAGASFATAYDRGGDPTREHGAEAVVHDGILADEDPEGFPGDPGFGSARWETPSAQSFPDIRRVLALPGYVVGTAASLTAALIESSGRCARDSVRAVTRTLRQGSASRG